MATCPKKWDHLNTAGRRPKDTEVHATTRAEPITVDQQVWPLAHSTFIAAEDSERREQVVVLGPTVAEALFESGIDPVGEHVQIAGIPFLVKGVLEQSPMPTHVNLSEELVESERATFGDVAFVPFQPVWSSSRHMAANRRPSLSVTRLGHRLSSGR